MRHVGSSLLSASMLLRLELLKNCHSNQQFADKVQALWSWLQLFLRSGLLVCLGMAAACIPCAVLQGRGAFWYSRWPLFLLFGCAFEVGRGSSGMELTKHVRCYLVRSSWGFHFWSLSLGGKRVCVVWGDSRTLILWMKKLWFTEGKCFVQCHVVSWLWNQPSCTFYCRVYFIYICWQKEGKEKHFIYNKNIYYNYIRIKL